MTRKYNKNEKTTPPLLYFIPAFDEVSEFYEDYRLIYDVFATKMLIEK